MQIGGRDAPRAKKHRRSSKKRIARGGMANMERDDRDVSTINTIPFKFVREKEREEIAGLKRAISRARYSVPRACTRRKVHRRKVSRDKRNCRGQHFQTTVFRPVLSARNGRRETNCRMPQMRQALPSGGAREFFLRRLTISVEQSPEPQCHSSA